MWLDGSNAAATRRVATDLSEAAARDWKTCMLMWFNITSSSIFLVSFFYSDSKPGILAYIAGEDTNRWATAKCTTSSWTEILAPQHQTDLSQCLWA
jgi:hypothetical protein